MPFSPLLKRASGAETTFRAVLHTHYIQMFSNCEQRDGQPTLQLESGRGSAPSAETGSPPLTAHLQRGHPELPGLAAQNLPGHVGSNELPCLSSSQLPLRFGSPSIKPPPVGRLKSHCLTSRSQTLEQCLCHFPTRWLRLLLICRGIFKSNGV